MANKEALEQKFMLPLYCMQSSKLYSFFDESINYRTLSTAISGILQ